MWANQVGYPVQQAVAKLATQIAAAAPSAVWVADNFAAIVRLGVVNKQF